MPCVSGSDYNDCVKNGYRRLRLAMIVFVIIRTLGKYAFHSLYINMLAGLK